MPELIINEEMVLKQLNSLKIDKSPGPNELHPRLLKEHMFYNMLSDNFFQ
jgi:hypothetical protein